MASLMIGIMLFTAMGAAVGGIGIEALFFARFGVEYLPYMFIGLGITSMIVSFGITAALGSVPRRVLYLAIPLIIAGILVTARLALLGKFNWLYPALWLGKEILNSLNGVLIWGIAGVVCDTRQAKRLFPLFNASRILGQVIGGFATGILVTALGLENLLLVWAGTLLLAFVFSQAMLRHQPIVTPVKSRQKGPRLIEEMQRGYQYVRRSKLMRWVSLAAILFSLLYFSLSLPFSRSITAQYPQEENLATFLGLFNGVTTAAAFLASLFLANRLFARFGVMVCILVFPVIYLIGFTSLTLLPIFAMVVSFRFLQTLWLSGVADPAWQTMFNVVPPERRDQVRAFVDGVPEQAGTFIAGAILIIGEQTLAPQQLYLVGLLAAALCTFAIYRAWSGYNEALIDALRAGNPHLFYSEEQPFGGFRQDASAIRAALEGLKDQNPAIRRVSTEILGHLSIPEAEAALLQGIEDSDTLVRASSLRALAQAKATSAVEKVREALRDPEPDVRFEAVTALAVLTNFSGDLIYQISSLLDDRDSRVSTRTASVLLRISTPFGRRSRDQQTNEKARAFLRYTAAMGELSAREHAIMAMGDWGDAEAFDFLLNELKDRNLPVRIRRAVLAALAQIDSTKSIPYLVEALGYAEVAVQETAAELLGRIGAAAMEPVLVALQNFHQEEGALLTLQNLPMPPEQRIEEYARATVSRAVEYDQLAREVKHQASNDAISILVESLDKKSNQYGIRALRAIGLLGDRESMELAINILEMRNSSQRANVMEALESTNARWRKIIQPLMRLWEASDTTVPDGHVRWQRLIQDEDPWIRDCALFAAHSLGELKMENIATLSLMERILFFKRVPLFENLSPRDIKQVAALAQEESFSDGVTLVREGEIGDVMFIILSGEVLISKGPNDVELARRKAGEYVGEMALISREPRSATVTAVGDVRALCIDQKSFESLLRDRPDVSLAVIQILCQRLKEADAKLHHFTSEL